jgi:hypothetical protein
LKAFSDDYRPKETEHSKQEKAGKKRLEEEQRSVEQEKRLEKQIRKDFELQKKKLVIEKLNGLPESELENLKSDFIKSIQGNPIFAKIYETKGFDSAAIQSHRNRTLATILLTNEENDLENFRKNLKDE